jgi:hypothetical protein
MITYVNNSSVLVIVLVDGKQVGEIRNTADGWSYFPKGQKKGGEVFKSLAACKRSLED